MQSESLRIKQHSYLAQSSVGPVCAPDPSTIPEDISDIDTEALQDKMSHTDHKIIWNKLDTTYTDDERLFLYWHQRTRHSPQKYVKVVAFSTT